MVDAKDSQGIKREVDLSQYKTNGKFDTENGNSLFMQEVYSLEKKKWEADKDAFGSFGWEDSGGGPQDLDRVARKEPELFLQYLPWMENPHEYGEFRDILTIIEKCPEHARNLQNVFIKYPRLLAPYSNASYLLKNLRHEDMIESKRITGTRIVSSTNSSTIENMITANQKLYHSLTEKLATIEPVEEVPGYPMYTVATPYELAQISMFRIEPFHQKKRIRVSLSPIDSHSYDFLPATVDITEDGFIDTKKDLKDHNNFGYCFKNSSQSRIDEARIDEADLVNLLNELPYGSPNLNEAIESIPSVYELLNT